VQWMPDGRSFVVDGRSNASPAQLWQVAYPSGERRRITNDLNNYTGVSLSADAALLATVQSSTQAKIWIVPAGGGEAREIGAGPGRATGADGVSWTPDGRIVFTAGSGGVAQLWIEGADGSDLRQLTTGEAPSIRPAVSADGRSVYYVRITSDGLSIWRMRIDGSDQKQLTKLNNLLRPVPSPDGRFVYFVSTREGVVRTMRVPADGGEPSQVSDALFAIYNISRDGNEMIGVSLNQAKNRAESAILPTGGGALRYLGDVFGDIPGDLGFDAGGSSITYVASRDGVANVFARPLSGGVERSLTRFRQDGSPRIFSRAMSRDGRIAVSRGNITKDVVLIAAK